MRTSAHFSTSLILLVLHIDSNFHIRMQTLSSAKTGKFSTLLFILRIFAQNYDVFPWFYQFDIAVWNALVSLASKG